MPCADRIFTHQAKFDHDHDRARSPDTVVHVDLPLLGGNATGLGVEDRVNAAREVQLARGLLVSRDWTTQHTHQNQDGHSPQMIGHDGRYLEMRRADTPEVERTIMAPASCSMDPATAASASVSAVSVGWDVS